MSMSIATALQPKSGDPPVQVWAIAGAVGIGKTGWILQQIEQISAPIGNYSGWRLGKKGFSRNSSLRESRTLTPCFLRVEI
jgi:hypothetical protein